ncbi:MAG: ion transporter [Alphaproteobacteria bacterium]
MPDTAPASPGLRARIGAFVDSRGFQGFIIGLIVANAITLGLETSASVVAAVGPLLAAFDLLVIVVFCIEIGLKLFAYRWRFFRSGWNLFDTAVVAFALMPASGEMAVLRALRIVRVLRLMSVVPQIRRVVAALLTSVPGMLGIVLLLGLVFYMFAVIATALFAQTFPQWFGTIGESMYSLFQIMTLESWSMGIVRPVMEVHPQAWMLFVPFILLTTFAVLNLVIALIVNSMNMLHEAEMRGDAGASRTATLEEPALADEVRALRREIAALRASIGGDRST